MSLEWLRTRLEYSGVCAHDVHLQAVAEYSKLDKQKLTWARVDFLLETCADECDRNRRRKTIVALLDIYPPEWEKMLDYASETIADAYDRRVFFDFIFDAIEKHFVESKQKRLSIGAAVVSDILAIIPPRARSYFARRFHTFFVLGTRDELARHLNCDDINEFNLIHCESGRPSRVMSVEEREAAGRHLVEKRMEEERRLQELVECRARQVQEAELASLCGRAEAEARAQANEREILLQEPPEQRAALMAPIERGAAVLIDGAYYFPPHGRNRELPMMIASAVNEEAGRVAPRLLNSCTTKDEEAADGQKECSICMTNVPRVAPQCGHKNLCIGCTQALVERVCPICRAKIESVTVIFD